MQWHGQGKDAPQPLPPMADMRTALEVIKQERCPFSPTAALGRVGLAWGSWLQVLQVNHLKGMRAGELSLPLAGCGIGWASQDSRRPWPGGVGVDNLME